MLPVSFPSVSIARPLKRKIPAMPAAIITRNGLAPNQKGLHLQAKLPHGGNVSDIPYQKRSPHLGLTQICH
jgi:hypothetical protein